MPKLDVVKKPQTVRKKLTKQPGKPSVTAVAPPVAGVTLGSVSAGQVGDTDGQQPLARLPVRELALSVFKNAPDEELSANSVIERLKRKNPSINESSVRFMIGELKKANQIHRVRNDGHIAILKYGPHPDDKTFLTKHSANVAAKSAVGDLQSSLAVLKEATAVIAKWEKLLHRNEEISNQIARLRAVL
jgi:predicted transcriptional regulator